MAEAITEHSPCGPCTTRQHGGCIPALASDRAWRCGCAERDHRKEHQMAMRPDPLPEGGDL